LNNRFPPGAKKKEESEWILLLKAPGGNPFFRRKRSGSLRPRPFAFFLALARRSLPIDSHQAQKKKKNPNGFFF